MRERCGTSSARKKSLSSSPRTRNQHSKEVADVLEVVRTRCRPGADADQLEKIHRAKEHARGSSADRMDGRPLTAAVLSSIVVSPVPPGDSRKAD